MTAANLPREARAFLDAVAVGESDPSARHEGISPYFILYAGGSFEALPDREGYFGFPYWPGLDNSHAAGRYQFEPATWKGIAETFPGGTPNFRDSGDQDWGAWFLAQANYRVEPLLAALQAGRTLGIAAALKSTWTSLDESTFTDRYEAALALYPPSAGDPVIPSAAAPDPVILAPAAADPVIPPAAVDPVIPQKVPLALAAATILTDLRARRDRIDDAINRLELVLRDLQGMAP
jgi:muramidase (phage lysozyme)